MGPFAIHEEWLGKDISTHQVIVAMYGPNGFVRVWNAFAQCFVLLNQVLVIPGDFFDHIRVLLVRLQLKSHINGLDRLVLSFSGAAYVAFALRLLI